MATIRVRITTIEGTLGTAPANDRVYREYIGSKAPNARTVEEEIAALGEDAVADKGRTVFPRLEDGTPFMYDYQIKGFFKDSCAMLARLTERGEDGKKKKPVNESGKLTAYKKIIDGLIFVAPRKIPIAFDGEITDCERALRAQTAQGERISLASSDEVPIGSVLTFTVNCLDPAHIPAVREWLNYGVLRGIGQWRNSGKGRFVWDELDENGNVIGGNNEYAKAS